MRSLLKLYHIVLLKASLLLYLLQLDYYSDIDLDANPNPILRSVPGCRQEKFVVLKSNVLLCLGYNLGVYSLLLCFPSFLSQHTPYFQPPQTLCHSEKEDGYWSHDFLCGLSYRSTITGGCTRVQ